MTPYQTLVSLHLGDAWIFFDEAPRCVNSWLFSVVARLGTRQIALTADLVILNGPPDDTFYGDSTKQVHD